MAILKVIEVLSSSENSWEEATKKCSNPSLKIVKKHSFCLRKRA